MELKDIMWLSMKDLSQKKVRTALTMIMVAIGVAAIIALISQTQGISVSIQKSLSSLGPTTILLTSTSTTGFTSADTARISQLSYVNYTIPVVEGSASAIANGYNTSVTLIGITPQGLEEFTGGNVSIYQGTLYSDTLSPSSLIGYSVAFPSSAGGSEAVDVGQPITLEIKGRGGSSTYTVPVTGILNQYGSSIVSIDTAVLMSLQEAQELLHESSYSIIIVKAKNLSDVTPLSTELSDIYGSNARVLTTQQLLQTTSSVIGSISLILGIVGGISLLVAAIGIMNVMLISVYERTHEIGIMKSIGFKRKHILLVFMTQALLIGVLGGISGIVLGVGASEALSVVFTHASSSTTGATTTTSTTFRGSGSFAGGSGAGGAVFVSSAGAAPTSTSSSGLSSSLSYSPAFTPEVILISLIVAILVSLLAGIYPAIRASKLEPIDALREL